MDIMAVFDENYFEGPFTISFMNGATKTIDVAAAIRDTMGKPLYLVSSDNAYYPWEKILSFHKG